MKLVLKILRRNLKSEGIEVGEFTCEKLLHYRKIFMVLVIRGGTVSIAEVTGFDNDSGETFIE